MKISTNKKYQTFYKAMANNWKNIKKQSIVHNYFYHRNPIMERQPIVSYTKQNKLNINKILRASKSSIRFRYGIKAKNKISKEIIVNKITK